MAVSGSTIDAYVNRITSTFDGYGQPEHVRSYAGTTIRNAVQLVYDNAKLGVPRPIDSDGAMTAESRFPRSTVAARV